MTNSTNIKRLIATLAIALTAPLVGATANANTIAKPEAKQPAYQLIISPQQCVAMRQGQKCYVDVTIDWQAKVVGNYCLHASTASEPLQCWQQQQGAKFSQEMVAKQDIIFTLQGKQSAKVLVKGSLAMAWVYDKKSRRNVSWRMF